MMTCGASKPTTSEQAESRIGQALRSFTWMALTTIFAVFLASCGGSGNPGDVFAPTTTTTTTAPPPTITTTPTGTIAPGDVQVLYLGVDMVSSGPLDFGVIEPGTSVTADLAILNAGTGTLTLNGVPFVAPQAGSSGAFGVVQPLSATPEIDIAPGGTVNFQVTYTPVDRQDAEGTFIIQASPSVTVEFDVRGGYQPGVNVFGNGLLIPNGDLVPEAADDTLFSDLDVLLGESEVHGFTINNNTDSSIDITNVTINDTTNFNITNNGGAPSPWVPATLGSDASIGLYVEFSPTTAMEHSAVVTVNTLIGGTAGTITFTVGGLGLGATMGVNGIVNLAPVAILDTGAGEDPATNTPSAADNTDYGVSPIGVPVELTFEVANPTGTDSLDLIGSPIITVSSPIAGHLEEFVVTNEPLPSIDPGTTSSFEIQFQSLIDRDRDRNSFLSTDPADPDAEADYPLPPPGSLAGALDANAYVRIDTNALDAEHRPFQFNITGRRYTPALTVFGVERDVGNPPTPLSARTAITGTTASFASDYRNWNSTFDTDNDIVNLGGDNGLGITIPHGQTSGHRANLTDFGALNPGSSRTFTFQVVNYANYGITLNDPPVAISGLNADEFEFEIVGGPIASLAANGAGVDSFEFTIKFNPTDYGPKEATIIIQCPEDELLDQYVFAVRAEGRGPDLKVYGGAPLLSIERDDFVPRPEDLTEFPSRAVHDMNPEPGITHTFTMVNEGNEALRLGTPMTPSVEIVSELGGPLVGIGGLPEWTVSRQPTDITSGAAINILYPGQVAEFDILYDPSAVEEWFPRQPDTSERRAIVNIDSSDGPGATEEFADTYSFGLKGTATDPQLLVRGRGASSIGERDYSNRTDNFTIIEDVDMFGGSKFHDFEIVNDSPFPMALGAVGTPFIDEEEIMYSIPVFAWRSDNLPVNRLVVPGIEMDPTGRGLNHVRSYASVITRIRAGDGLAIRAWGETTANAGLTGEVLEATPDIADALFPGPVGVRNNANQRPDIPDTMEPILDMLPPGDPAWADLPLTGTGTDAMRAVSENLFAIGNGMENFAGLGLGSQIVGSIVTDAGWAPDVSLITPELIRIVAGNTIEIEGRYEVAVAGNGDTLVGDWLVFGDDEHSEGSVAFEITAVADSLAPDPRDPTVNILTTIFTLDTANALVDTIGEFVLPGYDVQPVAQVIPGGEITLARTSFIDITKNDWELLFPAAWPDTLNAGEVAQLTVQFTPRWSTGFDGIVRSEYFGNVFPAPYQTMHDLLGTIGWQSDFDALSDFLVSPSTSIEHEVLSIGPSHQIEVNVPAADADVTVWHTWPLLANQNDHAMTPLVQTTGDTDEGFFEFGITGLSRDPQIHVDYSLPDGTDFGIPTDWWSNYPRLDSPPQLNFNNATTPNPSLGGSSTELRLRVWNEANPEATSGNNPDFNNATSPYSGWRVPDSLALDPDEAAYTSGVNKDDFEITSITPDLTAPQYQLTGQTVPTPEFIDVLIQYTPQSGGSDRTSRIIIPTNDGTSDPTSIPLFGADPAPSTKRVNN